MECRAVRNRTAADQSQLGARRFHLLRRVERAHRAMNESTLDRRIAGDAPIFEAIGLRKDFDEGQVQALRGVDLRIAEGEFVAITGPSGCGKTTLLQMLGGLDLPDPAAYRALEIGFVFQAFHLLPTFTSFENVQIPMFETNRPRSERANRARELLKAVGLEHRLDHFPAKLSGGERQRVAIARSLANGPSVLLADEPTGNLDSVSAQVVLDLIVRLHKERQMTLVLVTHDMAIARRASRALLMKDGQFVDTSAGT
jgi:ABC-type lipoprotein export system ATPase subunit